MWEKNKNNINSEHDLNLFTCMQLSLSGLIYKRETKLIIYTERFSLVVIIINF